MGGRGDRKGGVAEDAGHDNRRTRGGRVMGGRGGACGGGGGGLPESGFRTEAPNYITSTKDMQTWEKQTRDAFPMANSKILKEKVSNSINSLRRASDQYGRIRALIEKETSAKFWIDHRSTHPGDPAWKAFKKKIIGY